MSQGAEFGVPGMIIVGMLIEVVVVLVNSVVVLVFVVVVEVEVK